MVLQPDENDEALRREIQETVGPKFCTTLSRAQLEQMNKFMKEYEGGERVAATRTLESLDFLVTIATKMCVKE